MEGTDDEKKMNLEINNPIKASNNLRNNVSGSKMSQNDEFLSKDISKFNSFMFTPLQSFLLNKKMPHGFKFESEENIMKNLELSKTNQRRVKQK